MNQDTPAKDIKTKDLEKNSHALDALLDRIDDPKKIRKVLDVRYGLGGWAQTLLERFPRASIIGYEQDEETYLKAWKSDRTKVLNRRFDPDEVAGSSFDLILADFNTLTSIKRELLDELLSSVSGRFLIFTDVCCSKLHLNFRSYGLDQPELKSYWKKFRVGDYRYITHSREHHAASTALYKKKASPKRGG